MRPVVIVSPFQAALVTRPISWRVTVSPPMETVSKPTSPVRNSPSPYEILKFVLVSGENVFDFVVSKPDVPNAHSDGETGFESRSKHLKPFFASHVSELHVMVSICEQPEKTRALEMATHLPVSMIAWNFWPPIVISVRYSSSPSDPATVAIFARVVRF